MSERIGNQNLISGLDNGSKPDVLLVNSPINDYEHIQRPITEQLPAFGLAYMATELEHAGHKVGLLDAEFNALSPDKAAEAINKAQPKWVGINLLTPTYDLAARIVEGIDNNINVVAGGAHAKAVPERVLRDERFGKKLKGLALEDGEIILKAAIDGVPFADMAAVAYLDENGDFHNANHDPDMKWLPWELDTLMFPDRKFMPSDPFESQGRMETNMVGSRGCPFHCRFCAGARELLIGGVRKRSVTNILQEFQMLNEQGITAVRLIDDLFLADKKRMKEFFDGMISSGLGEKMVWDATARVNTLSKMPWELLEMMSKSGLREVSIGVESASPRILKLLDKDTTPDMVVQTVKNLSQVGVRTKGYFILGSPSETEEEMEQTVGFMHSLRELAWNVVVNNPRSPNGTENNAQFRGSMFEFRPYPGTRLYHMITGQYPWPEDVIWPNGQRPKYTEDEILAGFQPVLMEGLEERQKHNYTTNLELSAVSPAMIQERLKDAMMEQRDKIRSMGGYIPGVNLNGQRNKEIETG